MGHQTIEANLSLALQALTHVKLLVPAPVSTRQAIHRAIFQRDIVALPREAALRVAVKHKPAHNEHCCERKKQQKRYAIPLVGYQCRVPYSITAQHPASAA